jgi:hypothetical protein
MDANAGEGKRGYGLRRWSLFLVSCLIEWVIFMKKSIYLTLNDEEIIELIRLIMDDDAEGSLKFLKKHFKGKAQKLLESG